jgi:hypothetical protein
MMLRAQAPAAAAPATQSSPVPVPNEENLKKAIQAAQEAHDNQELEDEITQWRTAFVMATQIHSVEAIYVSALGLEACFKDDNRSLERIAALRSGVVELKRQSGAGPIWGAQLEVQLAVALEELGKRVEAAAAAKRAVVVLEAAFGSKSHDYRETLHTLATLFEENGNSAASEFTRRIDEIDRARENDAVFGFKPDSSIRALQEQLRTAIDSSSAVQIELTMGQISGAADKLDLKNPFRAKALSEAAIAILKAANYGKKLNPTDQSFPTAMSLLRKAIDLRERAMGQNTLADTSKLSIELYHLREYQSEVDTLATCYAAIGETKRQEELLIHSLEVNERLLGKDHPALAGPLRHLGDLYFGTGNKERVNKVAGEAPAATDDNAGLDKAIELVKREVLIYEKTFGNDSPILAGSVTRLGEMLWMKGDEAAAKACDARAAKLKDVDADAKTPEQTMLDEVKEHRAFLRFEEAEDEFETFKKLHPDKAS